MSVKTIGKIELRNADHKGWYLLSATTVVMPIQTGKSVLDANKIQGQDNLNTLTDALSIPRIPTNCVSTFEQLIKDNFCINDDFNISTLYNKLQFGTNIYFFDHELKHDGSAKGWPATDNFLQSHWATIQLAGYSWKNQSAEPEDSIEGKLQITIDTNHPGFSPVKITLDAGEVNLKSYSHIPIDTRKGYWVYVVTNEAP